MTKQEFAKWFTGYALRYPAIKERDVEFAYGLMPLPLDEVRQVALKFATMREPFANDHLALLLEIHAEKFPTKHVDPRAAKVAAEAEQNRRVFQECISEPEERKAAWLVNREALKAAGLLGRDWKRIQRENAARAAAAKQERPESLWVPAPQVQEPQAVAQS